MSSNHKLSKFKPSYKFILNQINKSIIDNEIRHPSNLIYYNFIKNNLFNKNQ